MSIKQQTYERVKRYMATCEGWVTPAMIERDFIIETPRIVAPEGRAIAVALKTLITEGLCERTKTGFSYRLAQFKYRRKEAVHADATQALPGQLGTDQPGDS